jgi:glutamate carboxypeptidase
VRELLRFCEANGDWLLDTIEALAGCESPSTDKAAVDACGDELARRLTAIGARVERLPRPTVGDLVRAEMGCGAAQVLLLGHVDTVWQVGQLARMPLARDGARLRGPGTFDMKAGIGLAMLAARALQESDTRSSLRIAMLWTTDEEIGSGESRSVIEEEARRSVAALVLEPSLPGGALKTSRKGCGEFEIVARGVAAHAGIDPGKGVSAIRELARQIVELDRLNDPDRGVTVNVGTVAGGTRPNVVAEEARASVDVRAPTMADAARVCDAMEALAPLTAGARIEVTGGFGRPPLERSPATVRLFGLARDVARELGRGLEEGGTGGGSDGNFTAAIGVPTLDGLGAVGDGAHALDEHVLTGELPWRAALVAGLIARLGER